MDVNNDGFFENEPVQNQLMALIDENQRLRAELKFNTIPPQRKPLTDEQIDKAMAENKQTLINASDNYWNMRRAYARIIEAAHGIKGEA